MEKRTSPYVSLWMDSPERYGLVSRLLHWSMAYLLTWQFITIVSWYILGPSDLLRTINAFGPYHRTAGLLTMLLVVVRAAWAILNRKRRPPYAAGWQGRIALAGHVAIYLLMFIIPALALLRAYSKGQGGTLWGIQLVPTTGQEAHWMIAPADALHGPLSWMLYLLIAGHVVMALHHRVIRRDRTLARMAGPLRSTAARQVPPSPPKGVADEG